MQFKIGDQVKVIDYQSEYFGQLGKIKEITNLTFGIKVCWEYGNYDFFKPSQLAPAHTLDALTPGDVVVDKVGDKRKVLERLTQSVLVSYFTNEESAYEWKTIQEMYDAGYTIKNTPEETVEEVTVEEVIQIINEQPDIPDPNGMGGLIDRQNLLKALGGVIKKS